MNTKTKYLVAASVALALNAVSAQAILFDPLGTAGANAITTDVFDWSPGNALATNTVPIVNDAPFTLFSQGTLGNFQNNSSVITTTGLNTTYEYTYVMGFREIAFGGLGSATFIGTAGTPNYFEIWYDPTRNANNLNGTGFNDGTKILSGNVIFSIGSYGGLLQGTSGVPLDQFGANNWLGTTSLTGAGGTQIDVSVGNLSYNTNFFLSNINGLNFNTTNNTPFRQVDPGKCMVDDAGGTGVSNCGGVTGTIPNVGAINGISGPDFMFQADAANSFSVPEPGSIALFGLGMAALSFSNTRRRKSR